MLFVSKNILLEKVAFTNLSCCVMCELHWIFMAIVKHFGVKMRLASFCCVNLIKYTIRPCEFIFPVCRKLDFHSQNYLQNLLFA